MKALVEPDRLKKLFGSSLLYKGGKALIDEVPILCGKNGILIKVLGLGSTVAVYGAYNKSYFIEYESPDNEKFVVTKSILDALKNAFKKEEKVWFEVGKNSITIRGEDETYTENLLTESEESEFPIKMVKNDEYGIIPEKFDPKVLCVTKADILDSLPSSDVYTFVSDGKRLSVEIVDVGRYVRRIPTEKAEKMEEIRISLDGDVLGRMIEYLDGDVRLGLTEGYVLLSKVSKDYYLTYLLAVREEE